MKPCFISGFSEGLDWRPIFFREPFVAETACCMCGLVSREAFKLICTHTFCADCHAQCVTLGGVCPLDDRRFNENDHIKLVISMGFLENRKVVCWNAHSGCKFVGLTCTLLEHFKQCPFHVAPCPRCQSLVLRSQIVTHYKDGCSRSSNPPVVDEAPATVDWGNVEMASKELKDVIPRICKELSSVHTSLNECREDVRAVGTSAKELLEGRLSVLSDQLTTLGTSCREGFAASEGRLNGAVMKLGNAMTAHLTEDLSAQSEKLTQVTKSMGECPRCVISTDQFHWNFEGWEALKEKAADAGVAEAESYLQYACGYRVSQGIQLCTKEKKHFGCFLKLYAGKYDSQLEWPFRKTFILGVLHSENKKMHILHIMNPRHCPAPSTFQRPKKKCNVGIGFKLPLSAQQLERDGFVRFDSLHVYLRFEPD